MNRNCSFASLSWRVILSLALVVALSLAIVPFNSQAVRNKPAAFPAPVLSSPANGTTTTVVNYPPQAIPTFRWQAVGGATSYRIQFANNIGFSPVQYEATTATNQYIPVSDGVFRDGTWYWRVRVESPSVGDYSSRGSLYGVGATLLMHRLCYRLLREHQLNSLKAPSSPGLLLSAQRPID